MDKRSYSHESYILVGSHIILIKTICNIIVPVQLSERKKIIGPRSHSQDGNSVFYGNKTILSI